MPVLSSERWRLFLALAVYATLMAVIYQEEVVGLLLSGATVQLGVTTAALLKLFGLTAVTAGNLVVLASGTTFEISYRCSGFLPATCLIVCILASHGRLAMKFTGIATGVSILLVLNQVRILHLILIHAADPAGFQFAHDVLWGSVPVFAVLGIFAGWRVSSRRHACEEDRFGAHPPQGQDPGVPQNTMVRPRRGDICFGKA